MAINLSVLMLPLPASLMGPEMNGGGEILQSLGVKVTEQAQITVFPGLLGVGWGEELGLRSTWLRLPREPLVRQRGRPQ